METKKITVPLLPTNKTQKRLYCASLDSTFEHDTLNDLQNYVNTDPTAYLGQILYCKENDTIYRIAKGGDGVGKIIKESGQKGDKGDTGEQGPKGDIGPVGPQGPKGDTPDMTEYNNRLNEIDEQMLVFDFIDEEGITPPVSSGLYDDTELKNQIKTINTEIKDARNGEEKLGNTIRKINERIDTKANKNDVAKLSSGTPIFVDSVEKMTETTKNYVNLNDKYVYIYDGSGFKKTDVLYQAQCIEDKSVTIKKLDDDLKNYIGIRNFSNFEVGNINNGGGLETAVYYNNIISRDIIDGYNIKIVIKKPSEVRVKITYYADDGKFLKHDSWTSETIIIQKKCNIRIGVCLYQQINKYTVNEMMDFIDIIDMNNLGDKISEITSKVSKVLGGNSSFDFGNLEIGSITSNGNNVNSTTRVRNVEPVRISKAGRAYFPQEGKYMVAVCTYNLDTNRFISQTTWLKEYRIEETTENIGYRFMIKRVDEANLTNHIPEIMNDFKVVVRNDEVLNIPEGSIGERELSDEIKLKLNASSSTNTNVNNSTTNNYIHISFDDVSTCIADITKNKDKYTSIFDNAFLNFMKQLHEKYGAVFSLYLYNINNLSNFPDKFKDDFIKSNKWLKFGLHAKDSGNYESATAQQGKEDWDFFITQMYRISGGYGSIDRIPRLHNFAGSKQCITSMRDCDCGALGFLSADDSRNTYYLNPTQKEYLRTHDKLEDIENGLIFLSTDLRLDWFNSGYTLPNQYNKPVKGTPYEELVYRYGQPMMGDCYHSLIVFTHEWEIYSGSGLNSKTSRVEDVCKFGVDYGYSFDFPQNRMNGGITSLKLAFDTIKSLIVN